MIGDGPLDALTSVIAEVISQYESEFKRRPTRTEWEALITAVLGEEDSELRPIVGAVVKNVIIEVE